MNRHILEGIYDGDVQSYRRNEDQAFTVIGRSSAVLRPWDWSVAWRDEIPELSDGHEKAIRHWRRSPVVERSSASLSELLIWCSQRSVRSEMSPSSGGDDEPMFYVDRPIVDAQKCGSMIINRRLVREALQVFVQGRSVDIGIGMTIKEIDAGTVLILDAIRIQCFVMGMKLDQETGNEPMPGWTK